MWLLLFSNVQLQQVTENLGMHGAAKGEAYFAFDPYEGLYQKYWPSIYRTMIRDPYLTFGFYEGLDLKYWYGIYP